MGITDVPDSEGKEDHVGRRPDLEAMSRARQLLPGECGDPKSSSLTQYDNSLDFRRGAITTGSSLCEIIWPL